MPKIRFLTSPKIPRDMADRPYVAGWEGEVSDLEAQRWLNRGVAELVTEEEKREARVPSSPERPAAPETNSKSEVKSEVVSPGPLSELKNNPTPTSSNTPMFRNPSPPTPKE